MRKTRNLLFGALVAASLGFGGAQALAAPSAVESKALRCTQDSCNNRCMIQHGVPGFCTGRGCWCQTG
jgi:hypothetical protein